MTACTLIWKLWAKVKVITLILCTASTSDECALFGMKTFMRDGGEAGM